MGVHINIYRRADEQIAFPSGSTIFRQGEPGDQMYVITSGSVAVEHNGQMVAVLGAGELLGELALIDAGARSASAIARSDCCLAPIDRERFLFLVRETPFFALQVMQSLVTRLRQEREHNGRL